jgi:hypothetical protein
MWPPLYIEVVTADGETVTAASLVGARIAQPPAATDFYVALWIGARLVAGGAAVDALPDDLVELAAQFFAGADGRQRRSGTLHLRPTSRDASASLCLDATRRRNSTAWSASGGGGRRRIAAVGSTRLREARRRASSGSTTLGNPYNSPTPSAWTGLRDVARRCAR